MNKQEFSKINEVIYHEMLDNGLNVFLLPKLGFHKSYVTISTNLGSNNQQIIDSNSNVIDLPMGIAHFLEHKLFEHEEGDVSSLFAKNQANVNAFTQNNRTTYLFSCTNKLKENIELLLNFVQNPVFTEKGVSKEIGIIEAEIKMYEDDPGTVAYMGLLKNIFEKHPVRTDILGTIESISKINKSILEKTHSTFYHPENMVLFVAGNFIVEDILKFLKTHQTSLNYDSEYTLVEETIFEDQLASKALEEINLEVNIPNLLIGIKQLPTDFSKENIIKKELCYSILFDLTFGKSSKNYLEMLHEELINDSFGIDITFEKTYGFLLIGSETYLPKELETRLKNILLNLDKNKVVETDFLRTKKQIIGSFIHSLNSIEYIANQFTKYYYSDSSLFSILDIASEITIQDIETAKKTLLDEKSYSSFIVYPKKK